MRSRAIINFLLLCAFFLVQCGSDSSTAKAGGVWDETETITVHGKLLDANQNPLSGARIRIVSPENPQKTLKLETLSQSDGTYRFEKVPSGRIFIEANYSEQLGILQELRLDSSAAPEYSAQVDLVAKNMSQLKVSLPDSLWQLGNRVLLTQTNDTLRLSEGSLSTYSIAPGTYTLLLLNGNGSIVADLSVLYGIQDVNPGTSIQITPTGATSQPLGKVQVTLFPDSLEHFLANTDTAWLELSAEGMDTLRYDFSLSSKNASIQMDVPVGLQWQMLLYALDAEQKLRYTSVYSVVSESSQTVVSTIIPEDNAPDSIVPAPSESQDAYISFAYNATTGLAQTSKWSSSISGQKTLIQIGTYDWNTCHRSLLRFPMELAIKPYPVRKATLRLYLIAWTNKSNPQPMQYAIHTVLKPWLEGNSSGGEALDATLDANSALNSGVSSQEYVFGKSWTSVGVGLDDVDASKLPLATGSIAAGITGIVEMDVTELVRYSIQNQDSFSFLIRNVNEFKVIADFPGFRSAEGASTIAERPALVIEY